jgi:hypothetical protein
MRHRRQRQHRSTVALEALADRLRMTAQPPLTALAALLGQVRLNASQLLKCGIGTMKLRRA